MDDCDPKDFSSLKDPPIHVEDFTSFIHETGTFIDFFSAQFAHFVIYLLFWLVFFDPVLIRCTFAFEMIRAAYARIIRRDHFFAISCCIH